MVALRGGLRHRRMVERLTSAGRHRGHPGGRATEGGRVFLPRRAGLVFSVSPHVRHVQAPHGRQPQRTAADGRRRSAPVSRHRRASDASPDVRGPQRPLARMSSGALVGVCPHMREELGGQRRRQPGRGSARRTPVRPGYEECASTPPAVSARPAVGSAGRLRAPRAISGSEQSPARGSRPSPRGMPGGPVGSRCRYETGSFPRARSSARAPRTRPRGPAYVCGRARADVFRLPPTRSAHVRSVRSDG